ncbi:MAG: BspA family leucine-rich repeat surface protein [Bacillota bacterium]|nr:BspA family leucine-rich repeat surface protein [Bacillota bacterium]
MDSKKKRSNRSRIFKTFCILAFALAVMLVPAAAFADDETGGDADTIYWAVNEDLDLVISDTEITGEGLTTGSFPATQMKPPGSKWEGWGWSYQIKSVRIEGNPKPHSTAYWFGQCYWLTDVDLSGLDTSQCTDMSDMFYLNQSLETIQFGDSFDTSKVKDMSGMFTWCEKLNYDSIAAARFDTSSCENMAGMFAGCKEFTTVDLSVFDTSKCENMANMFSQCDKLIEMDLSKNDLSSCKDMSGFFTQSEEFSLRTIKVGKTYQSGDIEFPYNYYAAEQGVWVNTKTGKAFWGSASIPAGAGTYEYVVGGPARYHAFWALSGSEENGYDLIIAPNKIQGDFAYSGEFNTAANPKAWEKECSQDKIISVTFKTGPKKTKVRYPNLSIYYFMDDGYDQDYYTRGLFEGYSSLRSADLSGLNTTECTSAEYLFFRCSSLHSINLKGVDFTNLRNAFEMFGDCGLEKVDLSSVTLKSVDAGYMFEGNRNLKEVKFNTNQKPSFTNIYGMFSYCESLESMDLSKVDFAKTRSMEQTFQHCKSLKSVNLGDAKVSECYSMRWMFTECESLESVDISNLKASNCEDMDSMFEGCKSLQSIDLRNFDTSSCLNMSSMFKDCSALKNIEFGNIDVTKCTGFSLMFSGCTSLESLDLSGFHTPELQYTQKMFDGCTSLKTIDVSGMDMTKQESSDGMFNGCTALEQLIVGPKWKNSAFSWINRYAQFPVTMYRADDESYTEHAAATDIPDYEEAPAGCNIYVNQAKKEDEAFAADLAKAMEVAQRIDELGDITSLDQKADVEACQAAYDALTDEQKANVPTSALNALEAAYEALGQLDPIAIGDSVIDGYLVYTVTNAQDKTVSVKLTAEGKKQAASVEIPETIRVKYTMCDVTSIPSKGFAGAKKLKSVTGGPALTMIGASAFAKDKKLSKCEITSFALSKIGKYAFKKDKKLKTLRIPNAKELTKVGVKKSLKKSKIKSVIIDQSKMRAYKKIFTKKNCGKKVRLK